ncbi:MAG: replication-associated recombination protein A, partial [Microthrixaceae bacterium]
RALQQEQAGVDDDALSHLVDRSGGDGRHLLTSLEVALALSATRNQEGDLRISLQDAEGALGASVVRYGLDDHYDVVSAFIKSIRGSDPDAALHYLARMLAAGEDARFIARRLVIAASEDIGLADPLALLVATAAAQAVEFVGLPEARINLAHATVHLCLAPKSNSAYAGITAASVDIGTRVIGEVPAHLRDGHYVSAQKLGHGSEYQSPHDSSTAWVQQQYLPEELRAARYYSPTVQGAEKRLAEQWHERRRDIPPPEAKSGETSE